jgi:phosphoribosyl 1,2-cyclic phosphodiesterase
MKFHKYYSSSRGNLYVVEAANGRRLLVDPGVTWSRLQKALDFDLSNIAGCLVTHEHKDHSKAIRDVLSSGIDVYASEGTVKGIDEFLCSHRRIHLLCDRERFAIDETFEGFPFSVHHDAAEPLGFIIREKSGNGDGRDEHLLFITDTSHVTQRFGVAFDIIAICCSYDKAALKARVDSGDINETFAKRLLTSHMERAVTVRYVRDFCVLDKCREIHLLHASRDNVHINGVRKELEAKTFITTY